MGDRVSIQFEKDGKKSVVLFSHWGGMAFVNVAEEYVEELKKEVSPQGGRPWDRLEPQTIMVDFVRYITEDIDVVESDYYFGVDASDGDNSDNGNFCIDLDKGFCEDNLTGKQLLKKCLLGVDGFTGLSEDDFDSLTKMTTDEIKGVLDEILENAIGKVIQR